MIDITLQNFQQELIEASLTRPVLLDIWAPWCGPCKALGPMLERLETDYAGRFTLAKLNSDEVPELAGQLSQMFGVRSIPFCVMFKNGQPVDGFVGAIPEGEIRKFLDKHVPAEHEVAAQQDAAEAQAMLAEGVEDVDAVVAKLREALELKPDNHDVRFDLIDLLAQNGRLDEARAVFEPVARSVGQPGGDLRLAAIGHWLDALERAPMARDEATLLAAISANKRDFDARFELAQRYFAEEMYEQALDALLEIIMRDKTWNEQLPRKNFVAILELLTPAKPKNAPAAKAAENKAGLIDTGKSSFAQDPQLELIASWRRRLAMALN